MSESAVLQKKKANTLRAAERGSIDKAGTMLDHNNLEPFHVKDASGRIIKEPSVPMLIEELGEVHEKPMSWWGVRPPPQHDAGVVASSTGVLGKGGRNTSQPHTNTHHPEQHDNFQQEVRAIMCTSGINFLFVRLIASAR